MKKNKLIEKIVYEHFSQITVNDYAHHITEALIDDIISDVRETEDEDTAEDEVCLGDIHLAIGRVLEKALGIEY